MKLKHISLMNVVLCFSVILIHLTSNPLANLRQDSIWYCLFFVINKLLTFAVPAFIFLSGFKLFNKYKDTPIDLKKFYVGRCKKIVIPYLIAYLIYFGFYIIKGLANWNDFLPGLIFGTLVAHFYYIILAIEFYLVFPLLNYLFKKWEKLLLFLALISSFVFYQWITFEYSDRFFARYLFYFVLGMFIAKHYTKKKIHPQWLYWSFFLPISIAHIYLSYQQSLGKITYPYAEMGQMLYVVFACIILYNLSLKVQSKWIDQIVDFVNPYTFHIFLYHIFIINIMHFVVYPHFHLSIKYQFIITSIAVFSASFIYCFLRNNFKKRKSSP